MIVEQSFCVHIIHIHRILFELCVSEKKERKKEKRRRRKDEQNLNFHSQFSQL